MTATLPADGAVLESAPDTVALSFNEPVSLIAASLVRPGGELSDLEQSSASGTTISISLPPELGEGSYALSWRAVSEDGHPISGTSFFVVGTASAAQNFVASPTGSAVASALWVTRLAMFIGLFFGVGGAVFRLLAPELPPLAGTSCKWTIIAGLVAAPLVVGLQGLDLAGADFFALPQPRTWLLGINSPYGTTVLLAVGALLFGFGTLYAKSPTWVRVSAAVALLLTGIAILSSGHASAAQPQWLTKTALFLHITTIAWWVGALFPLVLLLRQDRRSATPPLIKFSRAIPFAIVPLVLSGAILAAIQLGPPGSNWLSPYGQVLAAKLVLLVVLFAIASWNRWVLTAPAAAGDVRALRHMRRGIIAEILIILAVLGLVSTWRFTPPPRALITQPATSIMIPISQEELHASLSFSSPRVGSTNVEIALGKHGGETLTPRGVKVSLKPVGEQMAPIVRTAELNDAGVWQVNQLTIPLPGIWSVEVEVRVSDFELAKLKSQIEITP
ncbi:copper resistance CopC/CopD family protein [Devosia submarina]|uniref:copper resistance CopC/CopD family protein n=1 Tax=Devosia submarina TaxID=1173082 RepID=UPI0014750664|nr:copper resistance protein CopC [Devosia submarina]